MADIKALAACEVFWSLAGTDECFQAQGSTEKQNLGGKIIPQLNLTRSCETQDFPMERKAIFSHMQLNLCLVVS